MVQTNVLLIISFVNCFSLNLMMTNYCKLKNVVVSVKQNVIFLALSVEYFSPLKKPESCFV